MFETLKLIALVWLFLYVCWLLYVALMNLARVRKDLHPVAKFHAYLALSVGLILDALLNILMSIPFLDPPWDADAESYRKLELRLTDRLKRMHRTRRGTWRDTMAVWICEHALNQFDFKPGGHC